MHGTCTKREMLSENDKSGPLTTPNGSEKQTLIIL